MSTYSTHDWLSQLARESLGDFALATEIDADLSLRALRSQFDPVERDILFNLLTLKINRFCSRFRRWNLRPWEFDDVRQEAYMAFVDVLNGWRPIPGGDAPAGFAYYFMRVYPLRLTDRVQHVVGTRRGRPRSSIWSEELDDRVDPSEMEQDIETLAYIMDLSARLDAANARILLLRTADDLGPDDVAAQTGISRRTYYRRWKGIADTIRKEAG